MWIGEDLVRERDAATIRAEQAEARAAAAEAERDAARQWYYAWLAVRECVDKYTIPHGDLVRAARNAETNLVRVIAAAVRAAAGLDGGGGKISE